VKHFQNFKEKSSVLDSCKQRIQKDTKHSGVTGRVLYGIM
jgi:hypothetical protein